MHRRRCGAPADRAGGGFARGGGPRGAGQPGFSDEVRTQERYYQQAGIHSVPAVIINDQYLISGGQPVEVFEQSLRQIAAKLAEGADA